MQSSSVEKDRFEGERSAKSALLTGEAYTWIRYSFNLMENAMLRGILLSLLCLSFTNARSNVDSLRFAPGEIIVRYERVGTETRGSEIVSEHQFVIEKLEQKFRGIDIKACSPVFMDVINEMINRDQTETQVFNLKAANKKLNLNSAIITKTSFSNVLLLKTDKVDEDLEALVKTINSNPDLLLSDGIKIVYAEPNYLKRTSATSNDTLYSQQWSHQVTNIEQAWEITQGSATVKIAIIDTGVDPSHPDLIDNLLPGFDFVDIDTTLYKIAFGKDCILPGEDYTHSDDDCTDYNGHGTHCAGIAAAVGDNTIGVKGVAPNCKILPVRAGFSIKLYDGEGGEVGVLETTSIVNAINYAIDQGVDVISMSFGGGRSNLEEDVVRYAAYRNVVLVAAAGNNNYSLDKSYPAGYDEVLAVTSINKYRYASSFTNYGAWTDITAPGEEIISTVPVTGGVNADTSGYRIMSGTSMAAPYIAGVAALLLSEYPDLSNDRVCQSLRTSVSTNYTSYNYIGTGLIDVSEAVSGHEDCVATITSPHNINTSFWISQDLDISGRASGADFKNYVFDYADYVFDFLDPEGAKPHWQPLEGTYSAPVDSGYLATIRIPQQGIYWIRLKVISTSDLEYTDIIGPVIVDQRIKSVWSAAQGYESLCSPAVSDIYKDGQIETVFTSYDGKIYVVDSNGNNKPGWPCKLPIDDDYHFQFNCVVGATSPSISDLDHDGKEEIIVRDGHKVYVYKSDGSLKNGWPYDFHMHLIGNSRICSPVIADMNMDGEKEIILTTTDNQIFVFNSNGKKLQGWPVSIPTNWTFSTIFCNPVVSDLDGDGSVEIIVQWINEGLKQGFIYVYDTSGKILSGWPREIGIGSRTSPIAADINNDGQNEIIVSSLINDDYANAQTGIYVFTKAGTLLEGWPAILNVYSNLSGISAGDLDNDGFIEIIVGSNDPRNPLWVIDRNGIILWSLPGATPDYVTYSQPIIADINSDDNPEILIARYRFENYLGSILTVSNAGQILQDQQFVVPERIFSTPTIADMDDDNQLELMCSTNLGNVFCWDLNAPGDPSTVLWPTYQLNNERNGSMEPRGVPSIAKLLLPQNNAVNQPVKIDFNWNPSARAVSYTLQLSDSLTFGNILFEDSTVTENHFTIDSLENNKKYYWRVNAKNSMGTCNWSEMWSFTTTQSSSVEGEDNLIPSLFSLAQNFPNPFNLSTTISFELPVNSFVSLRIFDLTGCEVETLVAEELRAGSYAMQWNAGHMPGGIYYYRLETPSFKETKKLVLIK